MHIAAHFGGKAQIGDRAKMRRESARRLPKEVTPDDVLLVDGEEIPAGTVIWADDGLDAHVDELKPIFLFAPDTKIVDHPMNFDKDEWTCVTGVLTGTFTKPMPGPDGREIPPTGRSFKINMVTVGQWKNGKMIAESFFWDNLEFMKQIGVIK